MIGGGLLRGGLNVFLGQVVGRLDDPALERLFGAGAVIRLLAEAMARGYRPEVSPGFHGTVVYTLTRSGGDGTTFTLDVFGERAVAGSEPPDEQSPAAVRVRMPVADFARIAAGLTDPAEPLLQGRATFTGDLGLAARLPEMFGAPRLG